MAENPDIVVGTPSRLLGHIRCGNLDLKTSVEIVVIDEADLMFSFGYEKDMQALLGLALHFEISVNMINFNT